MKNTNKKKYIKKDIKRSYFIILLVLIITFIQITVFSWNNTKRSAKKEVNLTKDFLINEMLESNKKQLDSRLEGALNETPTFRNLSASLSSQGITKIKGTMNFKENIRIINHIKIYYYKKNFYFVYNYSIKDYYNRDISILIVKNIRENIEFVLDVFLTLMGVFLILNITILVLYRYFYRDMIKQISAIEKKVEELDFLSDEFNLLEVKDDNYEENKNIVIFINNMLLKLNKQKNEQLDFIHNASHEMKTPLTVMKGYVGMLERWAIDEGDKKVIKSYIKVISETIDNSSALMEKLLLLIENNKNLTIEKIKVEEIINNILISLAIKYPNSKIILSGEKTILSDRILLEIVLLNLIDNAVKYGDSLEVEIKIQDNSILILNNGPKIKIENLSKIFDRFYREDQSRNNSISGHGLGLSIVKKISLKLNLEVSIKNRRFKGVETKIDL